jgi:hypothetical protein
MAVCKLHSNYLFLLLSVSFSCTSCTEKTCRYNSTCNYVCTFTHSLFHVLNFKLPACWHNFAEAVRTANKAERDCYRWHSIPSFNHTDPQWIPLYAVNRFKKAQQTATNAPENYRENGRTLQKADKINKIAEMAKVPRWDRQPYLIFCHDTVCVCVCVCVCVWRVNQQRLMVRKSTPRPYKRVRRSSTTFGPLVLPLSEHMYGCRLYFSRNTPRHQSTS